MIRITMPYRSKVTTDHETIRAWAEERGGKPARVRVATSEEETDILRIDFDKPDPELEHISWDQFFDIFEEHRLAFLYQTETKDGEESRFCKFVYRDEENILPSGKKKKKLDPEEAVEEGEDKEDEDGIEDVEEDEGYDADVDEPDEM